MSDPRLARPLWRGRTNVDAMTIAAIEAAEKRGGHEFIVTQGSYQSTVAASAGTHDRGGVVDLRWCGHVGCIRALRLTGFWAWHRTPAQGPWPDHTHAVLKGHPYLAPSAARQITSGEAGRNGLANNGPDDGPHVAVPTFQWPPEDDMQEADWNRLEKIVDKAVKANVLDVGRKHPWSDDKVAESILKRLERLENTLPAAVAAAVQEGITKAAPDGSRGQ